MEKKCQDPIVSATFTVTENLHNFESLSIHTFVQPLHYEKFLIENIIHYLDILEGVLVWYYGYGKGKFDVPYLISRAKRYGLGKQLTCSIKKHDNIDVSDLGKQFFGLNKDYCLSMMECLDRLKISRTIPKSLINGTNYSKYFDSWLSNRSLKAIWYNQEDALSNLLILGRLKNVMYSP